MKATAALWILLLASSCAEGRAADTQFERDNAVITAVLHDLLEYKGEDSPLHPPFGPPQPIQFASDPWYGKISAAEALRRLEEGPWEALTKAQLLALNEAARDLAQRSKKQVRDFDIHEAGVAQWKPPVESAEVSSLREQPLRAYPPGFSLNNRVALVRLTIPWSIHVVNTTYVLSFEKGSWVVLLRQFGYAL